MTIWPPKPGTLNRPAYRSLAGVISNAIKAGEIRPGDQMPTHRQLAFELGLSVQTVSRAYDLLIGQNMLVGEVGRGTFARAAQSDAKPPFLKERQGGGMIDLSLMRPATGNLHVREMQRVLTDIAEDMPETMLFSFRPSSALAQATKTSANWLRRCGLSLDNQSILMTNGNTSAMAVALMTVARPGDLVLCGELTHHALKPLAGYLGIRLAGIKIDADGIIPSEFAKACEKNSAKALYLMPTGLNPMALTISLTRREELVSIARKYDISIIENDAWGPLQPSRIQPISTLAPERSFYFTSLTKCILPGLRTGYLVVPETAESSVSNRHLVTNWMATPLMAEIAARWIADGTAETLLQYQRTELATRNVIAKKTLAGIPFSASENGMHIWVPLPDYWQEDMFVASARQHSVAVAPGSSFVIGNTRQQSGIRVSIGSESRESLEHGLKIVSRLLRSQSEPPLLTI